MVKYQLVFIFYFLQELEQMYEPSVNEIMDRNRFVSGLLIIIIKQTLLFYDFNNFYCYLTRSYFSIRNLKVLFSYDIKLLKFYH